MERHQIRMLYTNLEKRARAWMDEGMRRALPSTHPGPPRLDRFASPMQSADMLMQEPYDPNRPVPPSVRIELAQRGQALVPPPAPLPLAQAAEKLQDATKGEK